MALVRHVFIHAPCVKMQPTVMHALKDIIYQVEYAMHVQVIVVHATRAHIVLLAYLVII
jgi:hypothetical protein